ncbi:6-pyruvoyl trahydropterin synthase family protein [[Eubacterium] cellulosolvens]
MYSISLRKNMVAQHYLPNEKGPESIKHSHPYRVEVTLSGKSLDKNGYLIDLVEVNRILEETVEHFSDKTLNEMEEFVNLNPSLENFAQKFYEVLLHNFHFSNIKHLQVKIWETDDAWASYQREVES